MKALVIITMLLLGCTMMPAHRYAGASEYSSSFFEDSLILQDYDIDCSFTVLLQFPNRTVLVLGWREADLLTGKSRRQKPRRTSGSKERGEERESQSCQENRQSKDYYVLPNLLITSWFCRQDMEKWAKSMNAQKEALKDNSRRSMMPSTSRESASADAGFAILEKV
jgi:hypothetical protein